MRVASANPLRKPPRRTPRCALSVQVIRCQRRVIGYQRRLAPTPSWASQERHLRFPYRSPLECVPLSPSRCVVLEIIVVVSASLRNPPWPACAAVSSCLRRCSPSSVVDHSANHRLHPHEGITCAATDDRLVSNVVRIVDATAPSDPTCRKRRFRLFLTPSRVNRPCPAVEVQGTLDVLLLRTGSFHGIRSDDS